METIFKYRVLYADTDAMGVVYYGNYLRIYEAARGDFLRRIDMPFSRLADEYRIISPVVNVNVKYHKFACLDDEITIRTKISSMAGARMVFSQSIYNADSVLLNEADVTVAFVDMDKRRPVRVPDFFKDFMSGE